MMLRYDQRASPFRFPECAAPKRLPSRFQRRPRSWSVALTPQAPAGALALCIIKTKTLSGSGGTRASFGILALPHQLHLVPQLIHFAQRERREIQAARFGQGFHFTKPFGELAGGSLQ